MNEEVGREVAVPGTYQTVEANPQGFVDIMLVLTAGFYDPGKLRISPPHGIMPAAHD